MSGNFLSLVLSRIKSLSILKQITFGFAAVILIASVLLSLPISSRSGQWTPFITALFTATTSTCVTGLTVVDTYLYWSLFGQIIILLLIQIGGVGFITLAISALTLTKKKIGLRQRLAAKEISGANQVGGIIKTVRFIIFGTIMFEAAGSILLSLTFIPKLGFFKGLYFAVFHSVSAFCNAGIDLMSCFKEGSSLITMQSDYLFIITVMMLIVLGGLGFLVWKDVVECKFHFKKFRLQTKIVLVTTLGLIFGGALLIYLFENGGKAFNGMGQRSSILASFFQSVTTRTAGFFSVNLPLLKDSTVLIMCVLMFIGGSPGSTAGGIKTTSFAVLFMSIFLVFKKKQNVELFKRRISKDAVYSACCLMMLFFGLIISSCTIISYVEGLPILDCLFECTSAVATVGLSMGITPELSNISKVILILLMYIGRVGALTMLMTFTRKSEKVESKYIEEKISIG